VGSRPRRWLWAPLLLRPSGGWSGGPHAPRVEGPSVCLRPVTRHVLAPFGCRGRPPRLTRLDAVPAGRSGACPRPPASASTWSTAGESQPTSARGPTLDREPGAWGAGRTRRPAGRRRRPGAAQGAGRASGGGCGRAAIQERGAGPGLAGPLGRSRLSASFPRVVEPRRGPGSTTCGTGTPLA
jgi:hypothetical protein